MTLMKWHEKSAWWVLHVSLLFSANAFADDTPDELSDWREGVKIKPVAPSNNHHTIHSYFNTCPESPDGKYVLYYTSSTSEGESGDLRVLERGTSNETILAKNITTEDAHRAACQQWSNNGKTVVYHDCRDGQWQVIAVDIATKKERILAKDRQLAFGNPTTPWVPIYGCHWNPGKHRNLELAHVETGEIKTAVTVDQLVKQYPQWIQKQFGTKDVTIFFPIVSPDAKKVFFKVARPSGGDDFRSKKASYRQGKVVYDLENKRFIRLFEKWGHPAWAPDSQHIFEKGNRLYHIETGKAKRCAPSCYSNHPSIAPSGKIFVTDADVTKRKLGKPGDWAIGIGSMQNDAFVTIDLFNNSKGATSWRHNHPHPIFSADGKRVYYNVNKGKWTTLMVAQATTK